MLIYFALGDAKVWRWGSKPMPGPNANGFASQWNIGFNLINLHGIDISNVNLLPTGEENDRKYPIMVNLKL